ncbi:F-box/FBD/LRR-repeat protein [Trifolium medium]|uniref:F-box/FBD/LRR-repeat protein n=1 Tax=Trifolium medium TaxID=97028 RepID=A0A392NIR3_9FABA|nr:F-box/FBD/LRR-repeat protein [Trifolium medium]
MSSSSSSSFPTEDRVSALPDSILSHILSFLPTKLSAATSILSKRWKPLWLSLLHLDFDVQSFTNFNTFRHVVYSVMLSREVTLPIKSLRLKSCSEHVVNDINGFINAAMQRGIEYLDLEITTGKDFELTLTPNIFSCKTLMVLKLKNLNVNKIPTQVHFPLLKILHLDKVLFSCYEDIFKFPLFCPILEDLSVNDLQIRRGSKFISEKFISEASKVKCLPNLVKASFSARLNIPLFLFTWARILRIKLV